MKQILIVESSPRGEESTSRKLTRMVEKRLLEQYPEAKIIARDLTADALPHLNRVVVNAINRSDHAETAALTNAVHRSDQLTSELLEADIVVIACPVWNFGIPSSLKAWIDHVVRAGKTFKYTDSGAEGLANNKKAILVIASGAVFSEGPWRSWDYAEPYLRQIMNFIGIEDIQTIRAEGLNVPHLAEEAFGKGEKAVKAVIIERQEKCSTI
ncbi:MAG: FMN-dependent NADH-azoreductase [Cyanobacteria bacterium REEB67]|nr:FMN-dependent NADH-azoreductase [Cyanobacteria bacterium REEB67]